MTSSDGTIGMSRPKTMPQYTNLAYALATEHDHICPKSHARTGLICGLQSGLKPLKLHECLVTFVSRKTTETKNNLNYSSF